MRRKLDRMKVISSGWCCHTSVHETKPLFGSSIQRNRWARPVGVHGVCVLLAPLLQFAAFIAAATPTIQIVKFQCTHVFLLSFVVRVPPELRTGACTAMALMSHGCGLVNSAHNCVTCPVSHQHALANTGSSVSLSRSLPFNTRTNNCSPF